MVTPSHTHTPCIDELKEYLGGVILFEETLDQATKDGCPLPQLLNSLGIIVGIKVDKVHDGSVFI